MYILYIHIYKYLYICALFSVIDLYSRAMQSCHSFPPLSYTSLCTSSSNSRSLSFLFVFFFGSDFGLDWIFSCSLCLSPCCSTFATCILFSKSSVLQILVGFDDPLVQSQFRLIRIQSVSNSVQSSYSPFDSQSVYKDNVKE